MATLRSILAAIVAFLWGPPRAPGHCRCGELLPRDRLASGECEACQANSQW